MQASTLQSVVRRMVEVTADFASRPKARGIKRGYGRKPLELHVYVCCKTAYLLEFQFLSNYVRLSRDFQKEGFVAMQWHDRNDFNEEERQALISLEAFLKKAELKIKEFEETAEFPHELVREMGEKGFFCLTVPEEYGGFGFGTKFSSVVAREIAHVSGGFHLIWTANSSLAVFPILYAGTEEQKQEYLRLLVSGQKLGSFGITEPNAGSDAASLQTRAVKKGNKWVINGTKTFITNAYNASLLVFFARTGPGRHDISAFILTSEFPQFKDIKGIKVKKIKKRMLRCSDFCEIFFDNVELPESALLGELNKGFKIAMATLDGGRINIAAQALGIAGRVFDDSMAYVKKRTQFGRTIWENQAVQFDFADWYSRLNAAWSLVEKASEMRDVGMPITDMAAAAKLFATETAYAVAAQAARYYGGMAVTEEIDVLGRMLETFSTTIYEGTSEMQKTIIARYLSEK